MRIELLHIDGCPNTEKAQERLEAVLAALDRSDVSVHMRLLQSEADIPGTGFVGSPTITVDGADIFPTGAPAGDSACRVYATSDGLAGVPTFEQLIYALRSCGF